MLTNLIESVRQDVRYALATFLRQPAFTLNAVLAIALGIGATTAVFSAVDRVLFRALPYPDSDRLVSFGLTAPIEPSEFMLGADYYDWRTQPTPFTAMTSWTGITGCDLTAENPQRLRCAHAEASFLPTLGIPPLAGRNFTPAEDRPNAPKVALLSYDLWRSRFAANTAVLGQAISLDAQSVTVIGILPPDFEFPNLARADILVPQALDESAQRHPNTGAVLRAFARLKPGLTPAEAQNALQPLFQQSLSFVPPAFRKEVHLRVRTVHDRVMAKARLASWILWAAVISVLLIACANVATLLLARAAARRGEMSVRVALGGSRARLLRQTFTESLVLASLGAIPGCALAWLLLRTFSRLAPDALPGLARASIDARVLLCALAATIVCGILFGAAPALEHSRALSTRGSTSGERHLLRHALVAVQISVSLLLLTGAGLMLRTLWNIENAPLGMDTERVLTASLVLPQQTAPARRHQFFEEVESRLCRIPGVMACAMSDSMPPAGAERAMIYSRIQVEGRPGVQEGTGGMVAWRAVTPDYFKALGVHLRAGRSFTERDRDPDVNAIVLSRSLAARMFPNQDPLGAHIRFGSDGPWYRVIGIAADVNNSGIGGPQAPEYYIVRKHTPDLRRAGANSPESDHSAYAIVRTAGPPGVASRWIRSEIAAAYPNLPVTIEPLSDRVSELASRPRFNALLLALFAAIAGLLAVIGIYSVTSFLVAQRTQEIGVRMAMGATARNIAVLVLGRAAAWTAIGAAAGLAASWSLTRLIRTLLFQVPERDTATFAAATAALVGVALLAAWVPSWRAARVDPASALRHE